MKLDTAKVAKFFICQAFESFLVRESPLNFTRQKRPFSVMETVM